MRRATQTQKETGSSSTSRVPLRSRDEKKVSGAADKTKGDKNSEGMDSKGAGNADDVYEFKSVKETEAATEKNPEPTDAVETADPLSTPANSTTEESNKRSYTEFEGNEDSEKDDENKKKKRKEDGGKESNKPTPRGKGQSGKQSGNNSGKHSNSKTATATTEKTDSPKPSTSTSDVEEGNADKSDLKVPPLKIVIPQSSASEQETGNTRNGKSVSTRGQALPYVVPISSETGDKEGGAAEATAKEDKKDSKDNPEEAAASAEPEPAAPTPPAPAPPTPAPPPVELHPRKRKMKQREAAKQEEKKESDNAESSGDGRDLHPHDQPITNCYKLFMSIRSQIENRRKGLFLVQPKPPQGFKDYMMNRCTYVLANTAPNTPTINYPPTLAAPMRETFAEQEKERYRLRMQHVIEKEKLVLSVEQEILRVHGRAARALANQSLPFSVCTVLRDEEVYNLITPEQEEKDRNARSRYNGRLFLSWLQDVDDKWEKIKEHMLLRHHHEAESLHAVQKMNWEWKLKELNLCDRKSTPQIEELHVPEVHVSDDFDLLPA